MVYSLIEKSNTARAPSLSWWHSLPAILWVLILAAVAIEFTLRSDWLTPFLFKAYEIEKQLPEAGEVHDQVWRFYFAGGDLGSEYLDEYEIRHLADVKSLLDLNRGVGFWLLVLMLLLSARSSLRGLWLHRAACLTGAALMAIAVLATHWLLMFRAFHPLLFQQGGWDFHPESSVIVHVYTHEFISAQAVAIIGTVAVLGIWCWLMGRITASKYIKPMSFKWRKSQTALCLAGLLLFVPAFWAGLHTARQWDAGMFTYYFIALVVFSSAAMFCLRNAKASALAFFIFSCLLLQGHGFGVKHAYAKAVAVIENAAPLIAALEAYQHKYEDPPETLQDLVPEFIAELPPVTVGDGEWIYIHHDIYYFISFQGPLEAVFEYSSVTETWQMPPLP
ncbi:DUF1461 domain-containing protein [Planctomycetota bacterium]